MQNHQNEFEKGQYLVLFALSLVVFLAILAFAIDGGRVYVEQRRTQNAADNAALGTALALCRGQSDYIAQGFTVANENGYDNVTNNTVTINAPTDYGAIEAIVQSEIDSTFANIIGINSFDLTGRAVSTCELGGAYAIFAGGEDCPPQIDWSGNNTTVKGNIHSNDDIDIGGQNNEVNGLITYVTSLSYNNPTTFNPPPSPGPNSGILPYPVNFQDADYALGSLNEIQASANNEYHYCDCPKIDENWLISKNLYDASTNVLKSGLYYSTGNIEIPMSDVIGDNVTFVARGLIDFSGGDNQTLTPYVDDLLAFSSAVPDNKCSDTIVKFAGSDHDWEGIVFAPDGVIDMSGSDGSTFRGSLIGYRIKMPGSDLGIEIIDDSGTPTISLIE